MAAELKVDFISELKADLTYEGIDVAREYGKMEAWCRANGKMATKRRFVNWLNRVDAPVRVDTYRLNPAPDNEQGLSMEEAIKLRADLIETDPVGFKYMIDLIESDYGPTDKWKPRNRIQGDEEKASGAQFVSPLNAPEG